MDCSKSNYFIIGINNILNINGESTFSQRYGTDNSDYNQYSFKNSSPAQHKTDSCVLSSVSSQESSQNTVISSTPQGKIVPVTVDGSG